MIQFLFYAIFSNSPHTEWVCDGDALEIDLVALETSLQGLGIRYANTKENVI